MRIEECRVFKHRIPLRRRVVHARASRKYSDNVFMKVSAGGHIGYGECVPREYVTGENADTVVKRLELVELANQEFKTFDQVIVFTKKLKVPGCAKCALELALLDVAGKHFHKSVSDAIGTACNKQIQYSAIVATSSPLKTRIICHSIKYYRMRQVKLKVGMDNDLERIRIARRILGDADIRVDANGAWTKDEAIDKIAQMKEYGISAIEQPVPKEDISDMAKVRKASSIPIIADESLCTMEDAQRLIKAKACDIFDIRLSKCGGLLNSYAIYQLARKNNIECMLGCMVGETGILSAAGRHFAQCTDLKYVEGSYDRFLLEKNVISENLTFGKGGLSQGISGPGLGILPNFNH